MAAILRVYGIMLLKGMGQTLLMTLLTLVIATIIGMIFGLMNVGRNRILNLIGTVYVDAIRGVPLIVLAYFVFFGIPAGMQGMGMRGFRLSALQAGTIALSLKLRRLHGGDYPRRYRECGSGTDGGFPESGTFLWFLHGTGRSTPGGTHHDSVYH